MMTNRGMDVFAIAGPLLRQLDAERAHRLAIAALRTGLVPRSPVVSDPMLAVRLWNRDFPNPIGLAAGFDKNAEVVDKVLEHGFGFAEAGTVTPRPQRGNPRPRLFRLPEHGAVINRLGFNNQGVAVVARRLAQRRHRGASGIVGGNVGPNRDAADPAAACAEAAAVLAPLVDYVVVNVSSPNTPGLRALQRRTALADLLGRVREARDGAHPETPLLVKVAPDLDEEERADIAQVVLDAGIDGLIATNTTIERPPNLRGRYAREAGGLSGAPCSHDRPAFCRFPPADPRPVAADRGRRHRLGRRCLHQDLRRCLPVQLYTALIWHGPALVARIAADLAALLRRDGFASVAAAVGADVGGAEDRSLTA
ncbi:MAG: dihydroorotate dehydrogenase (quinone) [Rhodospirillales bacterium]